MGSERVAVGIEAGIAHVELARPDKFNAMDKEMFAAIGDTFRALGRDGAVRAILLSGQGRHFSAGRDLDYASKQFPPSADPARAAEARLRHIEWLQDCFNALAGARASPPPRPATFVSPAPPPSSRSPRSTWRSPRTSAPCNGSAI